MMRETKGKRPTHDILQVIGDGPKARWNRIGAGWANQDGRGMNLIFDAYPVTGRVLVREVREEAPDGGEGQ